MDQWRGGRGCEGNGITLFLRALCVSRTYCLSSVVIPTSMIVKIVRSSDVSEMMSGI